MKRVNRLEDIYPLDGVPNYAAAAAVAARRAVCHDASIEEAGIERQICPYGKSGTTTP
jgi:hypothetical protein